MNWLLLVALFGVTVPNGLFIYWLLAEYHGLGAVLQDKLAVAFSILGGLGFSLPFYYWLNVRATARGPA